MKKAPTRTGIRVRATTKKRVASIMTHTSGDARDDAPVVSCRPRVNNFPAGHEISLVVDDCPFCLAGGHIHPGGLEKRPLYTVRSAPCCGFRRECDYQLAPAPDGGAA